MSLKALPEVAVMHFLRLQLTHIANCLGQASNYRETTAVCLLKIATGRNLATLQTLFVASTLLLWHIYCCYIFTIFLHFLLFSQFNLAIFTRVLAVLLCALFTATIASFFICNAVRYFFCFLVNFPSKIILLAYISSFCHIHFSTSTFYYRQAWLLVLAVCFYCCCSRGC